MPEVTVTVNGRDYRLECNDGEETQLLGLAKEIGQHIDRLRARFGQAGDDRLLLMAGLIVADELSETRAKLKEANAALARVQDASASADAGNAAARADLADKIAAAAARIEALSADLAPSDAAHNGR